MTQHSSEQPKVCLCQGVCPVYQEGFKLANNTCPLKGCKHDTRSRLHPAPAPTHQPLPCYDCVSSKEAIARKAREDVLKELEGWELRLKPNPERRPNGQHFVIYCEDFKKKLQSLRGAEDRHQAGDQHESTAAKEE